MTVSRAFWQESSGADMSERKTPLIIAHRGAGPCASENTLQAFKRAVDMGVDMIEFDIRRTVDGEFVVHHNASIDGRRIAEMTLSRLRELDSEERAITTLDEVLVAVPVRVGLDIELKEEGYERDVVQRVLDHRTPQEFSITSFHDRSVCAVRASFPDVRTGLIVGARHVSLFKRLREVFPARRVRACWANGVAPHFRLLRLGYLRRMNRAGIQVCVWTVNDEKMLARLVADSRVHAILTDEPELALRLRAERSARIDSMQ